MSDKTLTWGLLICTYNRQAILLKCIELALNQTRPLSEIVIVDASDNWHETKEIISTKFRNELRDIDFIYEEAIVRSTTHQRNQAIKIAKADIHFAIDDDSLMYPDCAEKIMTVYEADLDEEVALIGAGSTDRRPDISDEINKIKPESKNKKSKWSHNKARKLLEKQLEHQFLPYKFNLKQQKIPESLRKFDIKSYPDQSGFRITFRRKYGLKVLWDETLKFYALHEDKDFAHRMLAKGLVVILPEAKLCHVQATGGRLSRAITSRFMVTNLIALHKNYNSRNVTNFVRLFLHFLKFSLIYCFIDLARKRFSFVTARSYILGIYYLIRFWMIDDDSFTQYYHDFQEKLVNA